MVKHFILLLLSLILLQNVDAQSFKSFVKAGDKAMQEGNYNSALEYYSDALTKKPDDLEVSYKYAEVARMFFAYELAEDYYKRIVYGSDASKLPLALFRLAQVKQLQGQYTAAKSLYQKYISDQKGGDASFVADAQQQIVNCEWALRLMETEDLIQVDQLNKRVNTPYSEFAPMLAGDTLLYSSLRYDNSKDEHDPPRKISKVLNSIRGAKGRPLGRGFNVSNQHNAHAVFNRSKKRMYYTLCSYVGEVKINCAIYYREKDKRRRWKKPVKLPEPINLEGYTATQPSLGYDSTGREYLFFVSDRPEGKGGLDIWYSSRVKDAQFSKPENLGSLNTKEDDATPFFHNSSQTLFFSSKGYQGLGGYDIYKSAKLGEEWSAAEHTGYPLNSSYNDVYFIVNQDSTAGYFSSNRLGSFYLDKNNKACCNDIYKVTFLEDSTSVPPIPDSLTVVFIPPTPDEEDIPKVPNTIEPEPEPTTLEDFLPLALYFDNDEPDKRTRRTTTKKSYEETYRKYYARKAQYFRAYTQPLEEEERWDAEEELDQFFEHKVRRGYEFLDKFSTILLKRLEQGETVEIFVKGFTSPRAKSDYNLSLGKRRVSSVRNHFDRYRDGIFKPYLDTKKLIISEKSFGETTAAAGISDDLNDQRNSVYSVAAASERRVEIVEIKRSK